jgi:hypothetical protein
MNEIYIKYENKKSLINTNNYQSIASIINDYLKKDDNDGDTDNTHDISDYFLDYNGIYLNCNFSLEKYNICNNSELTLNKKKRGGNSFFSFAAKNPIMVAICMIIALLPIILLPMGYIPSTATLISIIIKKSINTIGKYLVCTLGKITLFNRLLFLADVIKYIMFILMIFVIITFPLIILCITVKGHSIMDNPKNMCKAIKTGKTAGIVLTMIYLFIYLTFRGVNFFVNPIINLLKQNYITNTILVPLINGILSMYNKMKYMIIFSIPTIGTVASAYCTFLGLAMNALKIVLTSITDIGCKSNFDKKKFKKSIMKNINKMHNTSLNEHDSFEETEKIVSLSFKDKPEICHKDDTPKCCAPNNYVNIANSLNELINDSLTSSIIKETGLYTSFILFIEAFYENALVVLTGNIDLISMGLQEQKIYLQDILEEKFDIISINTKKIINEFLKTENKSLINEIVEGLKNNNNRNFSVIDDIKYKLEILENNMVLYAKENKSKYTPGNSLFKTVLKIILVDIFCNVSSTAKSSQNIITEMGSAIEVTDMLKSGAGTGFYMSIIYLITFIVLIVCGIFNVF